MEQTTSTDTTPRTRPSAYPPAVRVTLVCNECQKRVTRTLRKGFCSTDCPKCGGADMEPIGV